MGRGQARRLLSGSRRRHRLVGGLARLAEPAGGQVELSQAVDHGGPHEVVLQAFTELERPPQVLTGSGQLSLLEQDEAEVVLSRGHGALVVEQAVESQRLR